MGRWLIAGAVAGSIALAVALYLTSRPAPHRRDQVEHYVTVSELLAAPDLDRTLRVFGRVEDGSLMQRLVDNDSIQTFTLEDKGAKLRVRHHGALPDLFREGAECIATGHLDRDGSGFVFEASDVVARPPRF